MVVKLVSYNILNGGEGRADPLAEIIEAQRPDIVVLVEADVPAVVERIAGRMNMDFAFGEGKRHGAAILSRWPIVESINHSLLRQELADALLEATIREPGGTQWTVAAVHLHPRARESDEDVRVREVQVILEVFEDRRRSHVQHLLAGDFNANSPIQQIDPQTCKKRTRLEWEENGGKIPRRAVQILLDAGYADSLHACRGEAAGTTGSFSTQHPGQRVDYIFTHGIDAGRMISAGVETDRLARYASDHFPIWAEIR
jgi:exodeoxyribonuclease-3